MTMEKFPSVNQYRDVIRNVKNRIFYAGKDDNGDPIFDASRKLPTLKFRGTVKLHGTNAGIIYDERKLDLQYQSRERILSLTSDNAGFMLTMSQSEQLLYDALAVIAESEADGYVGPHKVGIYGEWCGSGIQKNVAISQISKRFVVFGIRTFTNSGDGESIEKRWIPLDEIDRTLFRDIPNLYFIDEVGGTFEMDIDFKYPEIAQQKMVDLTIAVEDECPVGKHFGVSGTGEGVVWTCITPHWTSSDYWCKVKGERHVSGVGVQGLRLSPEDQSKLINFCSENKISNFQFQFSE